jgi:hypothetical protein
MIINADVNRSQEVNVKITYNWRGARIDMFGKRYFIDGSKLLQIAAKLIPFRKLLQ